MREAYYYIRRQKIQEIVDKETGETEELVSRPRVGIVYLLHDNVQAARGVSFLNDIDDQFTRDGRFIKDKRKSMELGQSVYVWFEGGLRIARDRAVKAFMSKSSSGFIKSVLPIDKTMTAIFGSKNNGYRCINLPFDAKSEYNPRLLDFEMDILFPKGR